MSLPASIDDTLALLAGADYIAERALATALFLALKMGKPLFLEGEAGVGKTEIAKVVAQTLGRKLVRLQCYEGLDIASAVYEWNYPRQMIEIRLAEAAGKPKETIGDGIFSERFLIKRPLLQALEGKPGAAPVLLMSASVSAARRDALARLVPELEEIEGPEDLEAVSRYRLEPQLHDDVPWPLVTQTLAAGGKVLCVSNRVALARKRAIEAALRFPTVPALAYHSRYR